MSTSSKPSSYERRNELIAGGSSGAIGTVIGQPLDSIKVWLQSHPVADGRWSIIQSHLHHRGMFALMEGTLPAMVSRFFIQAFSFNLLSTYRTMLHNFSPSTFPVPTSDTKSTNRTNEFYLPSPLSTTMSAGLLSGVVLTPMTCVLDLIKIQHQTATSVLKQAGSNAATPVWRGTIPFTLDAVRKHGALSLGLGMAPTALRTVTFWGIYYTAYEATIAYFNGFTETGNSDVKGLRNSLVVMLGGSIAGGIGWFCTLPVDFIKTRIQSQTIGALKYSSATQCARHIFRTDGASAFFRGGTAMVVRGMLVNAVVFLTYEHILKSLKSMRQ